MKEAKRYPMNAFRVCVDEKTTPSRGCIHTPLCDEEIAFYGFKDILLKMDEVFDQAGYPQAYQERRTFGKQEVEHNLYHGIPDACIDSGTMFAFFGEKQTLDILVTSRRNASWQGRLFDESGQCVGTFDGDMELMDLLTHMD